LIQTKTSKLLPLTSTKQDDETAETRMLLPLTLSKSVDGTSKRLTIPGSGQGLPTWPARKASFHVSDGFSVIWKVRRLQAAAKPWRSNEIATKQGPN
jgi:hypothetical protein